MRLRIAAPLLVLAAAACGSSHSTAPKPKPHRAAVPFRAVLHAPTHTPKAGTPWLYSVRVTDPQGRPIRARITMRILLGGIAVGKVDAGKTFSFVGTWRERIDIYAYFNNDWEGHALRNATWLKARLQGDLANS